MLRKPLLVKLSYSIRQQMLHQMVLTIIILCVHCVGIHIQTEPENYNEANSSAGHPYFNR